jgi:hypothetical protein
MLLKLLLLLITAVVLLLLLWRLVALPSLAYWRRIGIEVLCGDVGAGVDGCKVERLIEDLGNASS